MPQTPLEGVSLAPTFADANAPEADHTQYFEMMGHRSRYHAGWRAVCPWPGPSFQEAGRFFGAPISADELKRLDGEGWELYHVAEDWAETRNLAGAHPERLQELVQRWYAEAERYKVLPIDSRGSTRLQDERSEAAPARNYYVFFPGTQMVPGNATVNVINRAHSITAEVEIPAEGAKGVLLSYGGNEGGRTWCRRRCCRSAPLSRCRLATTACGLSLNPQARPTSRQARGCRGGGSSRWMADWWGRRNSPQRCRSPMGWEADWCAAPIQDHR